MRKIPANIAILIVLGLALVCITVLAALHSPVPEVLTTVALVAAGGGAGLSLPSLQSTQSLPAAPYLPAVPQGATTPITTPTTTP